MTGMKALRRPAEVVGIVPAGQTSEWEAGLPLWLDAVQDSKNRPPGASQACEVSGVIIFHGGAVILDGHRAQLIEVIALTPVRQP